MAGWLEQGSQWHEMYCHDLEVMSSNPSRVELGVRSSSTSVLGRKKIIFPGDKTGMDLLKFDIPLPQIKVPLHLYVYMVQSCGKQVLLSSSVMRVSLLATLTNVKIYDT